MKTTVLKIDSAKPDFNAITTAVSILQQGGLIAFPTETVYGLGANAFDEAAVRRIFEAKGRPPRNPLIVHVSTVDAARQLADEWPDSAMQLCDQLWPGPLTIVVTKSDAVPDVVTARGSTVAIRIPSHPVALKLLTESGLPIAAPSANRSSGLSPTQAEHVLRDLDGRIDLVLDGGQTSGGLESTVLDVTSYPPRLLRPGLVSPEQIREIVGSVIVPSAEMESEGTLRSPGMLGKHYSPRTPVICVEGDATPEVVRLLSAGLSIGWLAFGKELACDRLEIITLSDDPREYSQGLYASLHELDGGRLDRIVVSLPPATEDWLAVRDRLQRASLGY